MAKSWTLLLAASLIGLDQFTKYLATAFLMERGSVAFIPGVLELRYARNQGAAFSVLSGYRWFLVILTALALAVVLYILLAKKLKFKSQHICLTLVFAGGAGNLIDRVLHGYVVDFFNTLFIEFPIFNVADCFIVVGVILLLLCMFQQEYREHKKKERSTSAAPQANGEEK